MSIVHSGEARNRVGAANVAARRRAIPNGGWGVLLLLASEFALLGCFISSYFYLRFTSEEWPQGGIAEPRVLVPLILLAVLVATSVPMFLASAAARRGRVVAARLALLAALVLQSGYFAYEMHAYIDDLDAFVPQDNAYASIYYALLGAHHGHVFVGMLLNVWLLGRLLTGLTPYRVTGVRVTAWYWHFTNAMAIAVVLTILSPSLA